MLINELSNDDHVNFTQATMKTIPCTSGRPRVICATNVNGQTCDGDSGSAVVGQSENYIITWDPQVYTLTGLEKWPYPTFYTIILPLINCSLCSTADRDNNGVWVVYGVTSYGYGSCGYSGRYSGFTDVSEWSGTLIDIAQGSSKSNQEVTSDLK